QLKDDQADKGSGENCAGGDLDRALQIARPVYEVDPGTSLRSELVEKRRQKGPVFERVVVMKRVVGDFDPQPRLVAEDDIALSKRIVAVKLRLHFDPGDVVERSSPRTLTARPGERRVLHHKAAFAAAQSRMRQVKFAAR